MSLPLPGDAYDASNEAQTREQIQRELDRRLLRGVDIGLDNDERLILVSPDGTRYALTVDNAGTLGTTAV